MTVRLLKCGLRVKIHSDSVPKVVLVSINLLVKARQIKDFLIKDLADRRIKRAKF